MTLNILLKNTGLFLLLVFLQVFIFNNIHFTTLKIDINFYVLLILLLSFDISGWALLLTAFFVGLFFDMFADTGGVHSASLVFIAFLRPFVLNLLKPRDGYLPDTVPGINTYGLSWFIKYVFILVFFQNIAYYLLIQYSFKDLGNVIFRAIVSSIIVLILIVSGLILFSGNKVKNN